MRPQRVIAVLRDLDRLAGQKLWPGFEPQRIPVAVFDGTATYLLRHPRPPDGFMAVPGDTQDLFVFPGQHELLRANTGVAVNGIMTATTDLSRSVHRSRSVLASLIIHEAFHVYAQKAHPGWAGDEAELFRYPVDDVRMLLRRRLETLALVRALTATDGDGLRYWAAAALHQRDQRFVAMPTGAVAYERGIELIEGLAQYVEYRASGRALGLRVGDLPVERVRHRAYATGQALALVLDRVDPEWKSSLGETPLDVLLQMRLPRSTARAFTAREEAAQQSRATREIDRLVARRELQRRAFLDTQGWRIEIVTNREPLWAKSFDPLNIAVLDREHVLHSRWLRLGNSSCAIEVRDHASLTRGSGNHPLLDGVRELIITGLAEPKVADIEGRARVDVHGAEAVCAAAVERDDQVLRLKLP
jgi:hypothetical protein